MYIDDKNIISSLQNLVTVICLILTFSNIILIIMRNSLYIEYKNIGYVLKLRNNMVKHQDFLPHLIIEIIIHIIQPYPEIDVKWIIKTLGIDVKYNLNSIFCSFTVLRMYVWLRIVKYFNMYYGGDIKAVHHLDIKSIYTFLYRSNVRRRPFLTMFIIFGFFLFIWSILFICYERFDDTGIFNYTWNVFWVIVVTITTSKFK